MRVPNRSRRGYRAAFDSLESRQVLSTLFVSPTGKDTNPGTSDAPFLTLQKAAKVVAPGDTVDVAAGNYTGFVMGWDRPQSGTADKPITFHAEPGTVINKRNNKTPDGINLEGVSYITLEGFNFIGLPRAGIRSCNGTNVVIRDNVADGNGRWGIYTSHDSNVTIERNVTSHSVVEHGIYVSNACINPTIRGNVSFGNRGCGIHLNGGLAEGGDGLIHNALIEDNIIYDNGFHGGSGINLDGVCDSIIRDNLITNNHASGISVYRTDGGGPSSNDVLANNTIVMAADGRFPLNIQNGSTGTTVFNNILLTNNVKKAASLSISPDSLPGLVSDNNAMMSKETTDGSSMMTMKVWQTKTGQDAHSIVTTPTTIGFVNPDAADYHLGSYSPAFNGGTAPSMTASNGASIVALTDLEGNARRLNGIDLGAYMIAPPAQGTKTPAQS